MVDNKTAKFVSGLPPFKENTILEVKLDRNRIVKVKLDTSKKYRAEGLIWKDITTNEIVYPHTILGWREYK